MANREISEPRKFEMKKLLPIAVFILLLATFLIRVFNFSQIQFDSDFGRDSLFAHRILHDKPTLLGAQASVGGFYLGPLYFYTIAAIFAVFGPIPEIVMLFFGLINLLAAWIGWKLVSAKAGIKAGLIFLVLFAFSPLLIAASRGATHMPMLPVITVMVVAMLIRAIEKDRPLDHFLSGITLGLFLHVHFSAFLLYPGYFLGLAVLTKGSLAKRIKTVIFHVLGLLVMASPLIIFDLRHSFLTSKAFFIYILASAKGENIREAFPHWTTMEKLSSLAAYFGNQLWLQVVTIVGAVIGALQFKSRVKNNTLLISLVSLTASVIILLLLYKGYLFSYYMVVPGTLLLLLFSILLSKLKLAVVILMVVGITVANLLSLGNLGTSQFRVIGNQHRIVALIEQQQSALGHPPFEVFKDSADGLTGLAYEYRFLLTRDGFVPESEYFYENAKALYVVREDGNSDPLKLGNHEIRQFNPRYSKSLGKLELSGKEVEIFVLTREL